MFLILGVTFLFLLVAAPAASAQYPVLPPTSFPGFSLVAGRYEPDADVPPDGDGGPATAARLGGIESLSYSDGEVLIAETAPGSGRIRIVDSSGHIHTLEDADIDDPAAVIGGRGHFVVSDAGDDAISLFSGLLQDESLIQDDINAIDIADAGPPALGGTWRSLWAMTTDGVLGTLSHTAGGWFWSPTPDDAWQPGGIGERTGGGVLYSTQNSSTPNQDCRIYARVGAAQAVAGSGSCTPGGGMLDPRPALEVALNYPQDVEGTPDGGFVIAERERLSRVAPDGTYTVLFTAEIPDDLGPVLQLDGLDVTPEGDVIFSWGRQVFRYDGNFTGTTAPPVVNPNPQPPPPPAGDTPKAKLSAALAKAGYKVRRGKKLRLKVTASAAGTYKLDVLRKGKRVKRKAGKVKAGANTIAFKAKLKPGSYKLELTLSAGGGTATDTAKLTIRR